MTTKVSRAVLKRMDAEVAELEEAYDALKAKRPRCSECGRLKVTRGKSKLDKQIRKAGVELREKRQAFREARAASGVV